MAVRGTFLRTVDQAMITTVLHIAHLPLCLRAQPVSCTILSWNYAFHCAAAQIAMREEAERVSLLNVRQKRREWAPCPKLRSFG